MRRSRLVHKERELPTYSPRSRTQYTEQTFKLEDSKSRAWLWLRVKSRSRENQLPLFFDRETVSGTVEVDFDKADGAKAMTISVSYPLPKNVPAPAVKRRCFET